MNGKTHTIRKMLTAIALSAATALFVVPLAQANLNDYGGPSADQPQARQPGNLSGDFMFRDYLRNANTAAIQANDHILDVSARDTQVGPSQPGNLRGDFMFRNYLLSAKTAAAQANDHILDVSARDDGTVASVEAAPSSGTDWQKIGIGVGGAMGGVLLLVALVFGVIEVRHTRQHLGSV